jgi:hypothetical protein
MKYFFSILVFFFLISCSSGPSSSTTSSVPTACSCAKNAMKAGTSDFDQSIQTACEEYAATLTQEQRVERAMKALECIK